MNWTLRLRVAQRQEPNDYTFISKFSWWICKTCVLYECEALRNFSGQLCRVFPLFFIMFDISEAKLYFRQTIYGNRLGKWDLAVYVEKGRGERKWVLSWNRALEVFRCCDVSVWNITDCQRRLSRFKSKLICFDLLLMINNLALWLI